MLGRMPENALSKLVRGVLVAVVALPTQLFGRLQPLTDGADLLLSNSFRCRPDCSAFDLGICIRRRSNCIAAFVGPCSEKIHSFGSWASVMCGHVPKIRRGDQHFSDTLSATVLLFGRRQTKYRNVMPSFSARHGLISAVPISEGIAQ